MLKPSKGISSIGLKVSPKDVKDIHMKGANSLQVNLQYSLLFYFIYYFIDLKPQKHQFTNKTNIRTDVYINQQN